MKLHHSIYSTLLFLTIGSFAVQAQDVKPPEKVISEEIEIIRPYKPILAEALKLRRSPDLDNLQTYRARFNYALLDRKLELNTDISKLQAQELADEKQAQLVNNYVKGALGSLSTILAEAYIGMDRDEALQTGIFFKHFSQQGQLNKQNENTQQLSVFGRSIGDQVTLNGRINYERHGLFFYGINEEEPAFNSDPQRQVLNFVELEGELVNKYTTDENALSYAAKINAYTFNDKFDSKEQLLTLSGYLNKRISSFNMGLAMSTELGKTKGTNTSFSNNILRLNPYLKLNAKGVEITAGINLIQEFGTVAKTRFFPAITADFTLIPDYLQVFAEVKGDVTRNSLKGFTDENPFLNQNIQMQNTVEKLSITGGIKGTGGPGFGYKAKVYSKKITDMPLFVNAIRELNKFDVIYDFGTMSLLGLEGELSVQVSDNLKWTGKLTIEEYKPATELASFFKPQLRVSSNLMYQIDKKISLNASLIAQDDSKAKVYIPNMWHGPIPLTTVYTESMVNLKGFVDLGVGADYKINTKISVFAKVNNLLNTNYSKYLYYRANGLNIFGGLSYSF